MRPNQRLEIRLGVSILALGFSLPAIAQEQTAQLQVEEILVTARKREERLQDIPVSVTAFTSEMLSSRAIKDITDIALQTPGFAMQSSQRLSEQPFVRGQSVNSALYPRQTVSSFVDGVWAQGLGRAIMFQDVERVEVLKGPQATVFGRASFAGAINYVPKKPTFDTKGDLEVGGGEHDSYQTAFGMSGAIVPEKLAARVFIGAEGRGDEWRNVTDGRGIGQQANQQGSVSLLLVQDTNLEALYRFQYANIDDDNQPMVVTRAGQNNCRPTAAGKFQLYCGELPITSAPITQFTSTIPGGGFKVYSEYRNTLSLNYSTDSIKFASLTAYNSGRIGASSDGSLLGAPVLGGALLSYFKSHFHDFTQDVRVSSATTSNLTWMLGASYLNAYREDNSGLFPTITRSAPFLTKNISGYGQVAYEFVPGLTGSFEGRYQSEKVAREGLINGIHYQTTFDKFLTRTSLQYKVTDANMLYASVSNGNKPGFFNTAAGIPSQFIPVKEESTWVYEIGTKNEWLDRRLTTNLSAFHTDWKNLAAAFNVGRVDANGNPVIIGGLQQLVQATVNAAKAHVDGVELETLAKLAPGWTGSFVYAYTDAVFDNYVSLVQGSVTGGEQVKGNQLWNTPKQKWTLASTYRAELPGTDNLEYFISADLTWRARQYVDELNTAWIPSMYLVNARIGVESPAWTFTIYARNLNNTKVPDYSTRYLVDYTSPPTVPNYTFTLRPERNFNAKFAYRF